MLTASGILHWNRFSVLLFLCIRSRKCQLTHEMAAKFAQCIGGNGDLKIALYSA